MQKFLLFLGVLSWGVLTGCSETDNTVYPTSISILVERSISQLEVGATIFISVKVEPENVTVKDFKFTVDDESLAEIKLTDKPDLLEFIAKKAGDVLLTVSTKGKNDENLTASKLLTIAEQSQPIYASSIEIVSSETKYRYEENQGYFFDVKILPENANQVDWTVSRSNDNAVVSKVNNQIKFVVNKVGSIDLTVSIKDKNGTDLTNTKSFEIVNTDYKIEANINKSLLIGENYQIQPILKLSEEVVNDASFSYSSNSEAVTVTNGGLVEVKSNAENPVVTISTIAGAFNDEITFSLPIEIQSPVLSINGDIEAHAVNSENGNDQIDLPTINLSASVSNIADSADKNVVWGYKGATPAGFSITEDGKITRATEEGSVVITAELHGVVAEHIINFVNKSVQVTDVTVGDASYQLIKMFDFDDETDLELNINTQTVPTGGIVTSVENGCLKIVFPSKKQAGDEIINKLSAIPVEDGGASLIVVRLKVSTNVSDGTPAGSFLPRLGIGTGTIKSNTSGVVGWENNFLRNASGEKEDPTNFGTGFRWTARDYYKTSVLPVKANEYFNIGFKLTGTKEHSFCFSTKRDFHTETVVYDTFTSASKLTPSSGLPLYSLWVGQDPSPQGYNDTETIPGEIYIDYIAFYK